MAKLIGTTNCFCLFTFRERGNVSHFITTYQHGSNVRVTFSFLFPGTPLITTIFRYPFLFLRPGVSLCAIELRLRRTPTDRNKAVTIYAAKYRAPHPSPRFSIALVSRLPVIFTEYVRAKQICLEIASNIYGWHLTDHHRLPSRKY